MSSPNPSADPPRPIPACAVTGLEQLIIDLVQMAEAPLYSTYRWLGQQLGHELRLSEFLRIVGSAVSKDLLRLWSVDYPSGDRTEHFAVPADLEVRYSTEPGLDRTYDPFGFSLTLGAAADVDAEPNWQLRVDFEDQAFEVTAVPGHEMEALDAFGRCFPDLHVVETAREETDGLCRIVGTVTDAVNI